MNRYEYKYLLSQHDAHLFYQQLKSLMRIDHNCNDEGYYYVESVYFDDYMDKALHEKIDGLDTHRKIRLRRYNDETIFKLEVKEKRGDLVRKESISVSEDEANSIINDPSFIKHHLSAYHNFTKLGLSHTVKYKRYVLLYENSSVRITFDYEVSCKKQEDNCFVHVTNQDQVVVEVKFNRVLPDVIESLMGGLGFRQSISKYAASRLMY